MGLKIHKHFIHLTILIMKITLTKIILQRNSALIKYKLYHSFNCIKIKFQSTNSFQINNQISTINNLSNKYLKTIQIFNLNCKTNNLLKRKKSNHLTKHQVRILSETFLNTHFYFKSYFILISSKLLIFILSNIIFSFISIFNNFNFINHKKIRKIIFIKLIESSHFYSPSNSLYFFIDCFLVN